MGSWITKTNVRLLQELGDADIFFLALLQKWSSAKKLNPDVVSRALRVLSCLWRTNTSNLWSDFNRDFFDAASSSLAACRDHLNVQRAGCSLVGQILTNDEEEIELLVHINEGVGEKQLDIKGANELIEDTKKFYQKGIEIIIQTMQRYPLDPEIQSEGVEALYFLALYGLGEQIGWVNGAHSVVYEAQNNHPDLKMQARVIGLATNLLD